MRRPLFALLLAILLPAASMAAESSSSFDQLNARDFGADATGAADSTAAINACLVAAGPAGRCTADLARFQIAGTISTQSKVLELRE